MVKYRFQVRVRGRGGREITYDAAETLEEAMRTALDAKDEAKEGISVWEWQTSGIWRRVPTLAGIVR